MRLGAILFVTLCGCARHLPVPPPSLTPNHIDIQTGWRLRVITPILKSGGYLVKTTEASTTGNTITLATTPDFTGYETAYYAATPTGIKFESATMHRDGHASPQAKPVATLFKIPNRMRFTRLVYVARLSKADHEMAVLAARDFADLAVFTAAVLAQPTGCVGDKRRYCEWIPAGIAVRPEKPASNSEEWIAAR